MAVSVLLLWRRWFILGTAVWLVFVPDRLSDIKSLEGQFTSTENLVSAKRQIAIEQLLCVFNELFAVLRSHERAGMNYLRASLQEYHYFVGQALDLVINNQGWLKLRCRFRRFLQCFSLLLSLSLQVFLLRFWQRASILIFAWSVTWRRLGIGKWPCDGQCRRVSTQLFRWRWRNFTGRARSWLIGSEHQGVVVRIVVVAWRCELETKLDNPVISSPKVNTTVNTIGPRITALSAGLVRAELTVTSVVSGSKFRELEQPAINSSSWGYIWNSHRSFCGYVTQNLYS